MYLLDTHAIIWYVIGSNEVSITVRDLMETRKSVFIRVRPFLLNRYF